MMSQTRADPSDCPVGPVLPSFQGIEPRNLNHLVLIPDGLARGRATISPRVVPAARAVPVIPAGARPILRPSAARGETTAGKRCDSANADGGLRLAFFPLKYLAQFLSMLVG